MKRKTLWMGARNLNEHGASPEFAKWTPSTSQIERLHAMLHVANEHDLTEVRYFAAPDRWGPSSEDSPSFDEATPLRVHEMVIDGSSFWFRSTSKYDELVLETHAFEIAQLEQAFAEEGDHVLLADDVDELRASIIDCGDVDFPATHQ